MAEWVYEESFGEKRALLIENDQVLAARMHWLSSITAGAIIMARVITRRQGSPRGLCRSPDGFEINVSDLPPEASEGRDVRIIIHREPMAERGRLKRAQGRHFHENAPPLPPASVLGEGKVVRKLPDGLWEDVWAVASEGELAFDGGSLVLSVTPAMTLIDIDGQGSPRELALSAIPAIAKALRWLNIGGSIGVDFPTIADKAGRKEVDQALAAALADWRHERTAMNGFGFVQIVSRMEMPSLLHRLENSRAEACARYLLRQASQLEGAGNIHISCNPAVRNAMPDDWLIELGELAGRNPDAIMFETNRTLALDAGHAQLVAA
ncbi:ribonuclease E/G [uncultured Erythrobacter sp.]|uniref:ribonuclease E/G n=1 Tax=uncultured Erythrobacter sp. TaxID=263913 RepID=UPI002616273D|nr:ribonuclease E/G [uncultured Erythrobacter sp.]